MNKDNAKDFLPLVQALADGKTIQIRNPLGGWADIYEVGLNAAVSAYRIKPDPIERWGVVSSDSSYVATFTHEEGAAKHVSTYGGRYFLMREVV